MTRFLNILLLSAAFVATSSANAQDTDTAAAEPQSDVIVVTGENEREVVEEMGKAITRPSRAGKPVARFSAPVCVKVSGMPDGMADVLRERIEENIASIRGLSVGKKDCKPNAFVGVLNNVDETVDMLRKTESWLFEGLQSYQIERIYKGSDAVRAWHVFDIRNLDGSVIPGARSGGSAQDLVNQTEKASRIMQLRTDLSGAVVLVETAALKDKTFRQLADYATIRLLASVSDEIDQERTSLPTVLTLFGSDDAPFEWTEFDRAYLEALYDLPANSRDGQVIAAAVSRYVERVQNPSSN